jgi:hypothetical protein
MFFAGCAATEFAPDSASRDDCFNIRQINNWDAIDRDHLYVEGTRDDDKFLLSMFGSCPGIQFSQVLALSNFMGRVCPNDFGRVIYRDGRRRHECRIDNVERVTSKDEAVAMVEGKEAKKEKE